MMDEESLKYGPDILSTIFVLGLEDTYTKEQLYKLKPVNAATEIAVANENVAETSG